MGKYVSNWDKNLIENGIRNAASQFNNLVQKTKFDDLEVEAYHALHIEKIRTFQLFLEAELKKISAFQKVDDNTQKLIEAYEKDIENLMSGKYSNEDSIHKDFYELIIKTNDFYQFLEKDFFPNFNSVVNLIISQSSAIVEERDELVKIFTIFLSKLKELNDINDIVIKDNTIQHNDVEQSFFYNFVKEYVISEQTELFNYDLFEKYFVYFVLNKSDVIKKIISELEVAVKKLGNLQHPTEENIVDFVFGTNHYFVFFVKLFSSKEFSKNLELKTHQLYEAKFVFKIKTTITWIYELSTEIQELDLRIKDRVLDDFNRFMLELRKKEFKNVLRGFVAVKASNYFLEFLIRDLKQTPSNLDLILTNNESILKFIEFSLISIEPSLKNIRNFEEPSYEVKPIVEAYFKKVKGDNFENLEFAFEVSEEEPKKIPQKKVVKDELIPGGLPDIGEAEFNSVSVKKKSGFKIGKLIGKGWAWGSYEGEVSQDNSNAQTPENTGESNKAVEESENLQNREVNAEPGENSNEDHENFEEVFLKYRKRIHQLELNVDKFKRNEFESMEFSQNLVGMFDLFKENLNSSNVNSETDLKKNLITYFSLEFFSNFLGGENLNYLSLIYGNSSKHYFIESFNVFVNAVLNKSENFSAFDEAALEKEVKGFGLNFFSKIKNAVEDKVLGELSLIEKEDLKLFKTLFELEETRKIINSYDGVESIDVTNIIEYRTQFKSKYLKSFVDLLIKRVETLKQKGNEKYKVYFNYLPYIYIYAKIKNDDFSGDTTVREVQTPEVESSVSQNEAAQVNEDSGQNATPKQEGNFKSLGFDEIEIQPFLVNRLNDLMKKNRSFLANRSIAKNKIDKNSSEFIEITNQYANLKINNKTTNSLFNKIKEAILRLDPITKGELEQFLVIFNDSNNYITKNYGTLISLLKERKIFSTTIFEIFIQAYILVFNDFKSKSVSQNEEKFGKLFIKKIKKLVKELDKK